MDAPSEQANLVAEWMRRQQKASRVERSRIGQLCNAVLRNVNRGEVPPEDPDHMLLLLALVELNELWFIVYFLGSLVEHPDYAESFARVIKDPINPVDPTAPSPGRDAQWELFCAAIGKRAGFALGRPASGAEYILGSQAGRVSIECKRAHSYKNLDALLKKAASQIQVTQLAGWICLDIGLIVEDGGLISLLPHYVEVDELSRAARASERQFRLGHRGMLDTATADSPVAYVLVRQCVLRPAVVLPDGVMRPWANPGSWQAIQVKATTHPAVLSASSAIQLFQSALPNV